MADNFVLISKGMVQNNPSIDVIDLDYVDDHDPESLKDLLDTVQWLLQEHPDNRILQELQAEYAEKLANLDKEDDA